MSHVRGLKCRETDCGKAYPNEPLHICEYCFGKLGVDYDYEGIRAMMSREIIESRPANMWRYRELLPIDDEPTVGFNVGFTPLIRAANLERALGHCEVYVKNDAVNYPTLSFKDRSGHGYADHHRAHSSRDDLVIIINIDIQMGPFQV